jgi:hypothetical protein
MTLEVSFTVSKTVNYDPSHTYLYATAYLRHSAKVTLSNNASCRYEVLLYRMSLC